MTDKPVTRQQLDALERAADKIFGKLGIDIEFTHHFLDRVNDARNQKQITIKELADIFIKEYKRWGSTISKMPIDAEAVMKDLSSAINIPFVLNKGGKEKDLVAKTVMRKKNFTTPDQELPVESIGEASEPIDPNTPVKLSMVAQVMKNMNKRRRIVRATKEAFIQSADHNFNKYGATFAVAMATAEKFYDARRQKLPLDFVHSFEQSLHDKIENSPLYDSTSVDEDLHGAKKGTQVKGRDATPKKTRPTTSGSSPHPMRGKLVGEEMDQPPLTPKTMTPSAIAKKHDVDISMIKDQLKTGVKIEMEHTDDPFTAMEIALDHLGEMPDYYTRLDDIETDVNEMLIKGAWECSQLRERIEDPREAILNTALKYLEALHKSRGDQQDIGGYAFDIARSFNLKGIATPKELANMYREWKGLDKTSLR